MRNRQVYCCITAVLISLTLSAQPHAWSLTDCEDYAVAHSISIKQKAKTVEKQEHALSTARNARLPDLSGSVGQNFSFGRGLTEDNIYTNTNTSNTSF